MARRKSQNRSTRITRQRDVFTITKRPSLSAFNSQVLRVAQNNSVDDRLFYPSRYKACRQPRLISGYNAPISTTFNPYRFLHVEERFVYPQRTAICVRRKQRKEVLFARGFAGSKRRKGTKMRKNIYSSVSCV